MFSIIQPLNLQKTKPLYPHPKYLIMQKKIYTKLKTLQPNLQFGDLATQSASGLP